MSRPIWVFVAIIAAITYLHARKIMHSSIITGKINPASAVNSIWVIGKQDSLKTSLRNMDVFSLQLPAGQYKLIIEARAPYKPVVKEDVNTREGRSTNIGEITLEQQAGITILQ